MFAEKTYETDRLEKVDVSRMVILNSGGPLMDVVREEDEQVLCTYVIAHVRRQVWLPKACLSRLVPAFTE